MVQQGCWDSPGHDGSKLAEYPVGVGVLVVCLDVGEVVKPHSKTPAPLFLGGVHLLVLCRPRVERLVGVCLHQVNYLHIHLHQPLTGTWQI